MAPMLVMSLSQGNGYVHWTNIDVERHRLDPRVTPPGRR